jgi:glycosyltransferase involved in cell wall biosynthesis
MTISIITATFNSASTVRDTIESVLRQTHKDVEYIIKDGGSKDDTLAICHEYEPRFGGRMKIISGPDKGIYDAMNQGIEAATGEVVGILNSDDFYTSDDVLATINTTLEQEDCDAVYGDIHYVKDDDLTRCVRYYSSRRFTRDRMMQGYIPAHPSFYCRRKVYQQYGLFDTSFRLAADFEQLLRLIYVEKIRIRYIEKDFVTMRMGGASTSGWKSHVVTMKEHLRAFRKNGIKNNVFRLSLRYFSKLTEFVFH